VWTWNAIGKRAGAWNLAPDSPEFTKGFLLNHLIGDTLPGGNGVTALNADPITGQAAWYDLRVRIEKAPAAEAGHSAPRYTAFGHPRSMTPPPEIVRYGARFGGDEQRDAAE
jgi:sulfite dehydrogenase (quinone) subunit SoeA